MVVPWREQTNIKQQTNKLYALALRCDKMKRPAGARHNTPRRPNPSQRRSPMAQATSTLSLDQALQLVKAAGYRVTRPKPRKRNHVGPTCVVTFADGTLCRMTTHSDDHDLDWDRGIGLCKAAWSTRRALPMEQAPEIVSAHFERNGNILGEAEAA
jgi:hypothetical protein